MFSARFMCVLVERPGHSQALLNFTMESSIGNLRIYLCQLQALLGLTLAKDLVVDTSYGKQVLGGYGIWECGTGTHNFQISKKFKNGLKCEGNEPTSYCVRFYYFANIFHEFPDLRSHDFSHECAGILIWNSLWLKRECKTFPLKINLKKSTNLGFFLLPWP